MMWDVSVHRTWKLCASITCWISRGRRFSPRCCKMPKCTSNPTQRSRVSRMRPLIPSSTAPSCPSTSTLITFGNRLGCSATKDSADRTSTIRHPAPAPSALVLRRLVVDRGSSPGCMSAIPSSAPNAALLGSLGSNRCIAGPTPHSSFPPVQTPPPHPVRLSRRTAWCRTPRWLHIPYTITRSHPLQQFRTEPLLVATISHELRNQPVQASVPCERTHSSRQRRSQDNLRNHEPTLASVFDPAWH